MITTIMTLFSVPYLCPDIVYILNYTQREGFEFFATPVPENALLGSGTSWMSGVPHPVPFTDYTIEFVPVVLRSFVLSFKVKGVKKVKVHVFIKNKAPIWLTVSGGLDN